MKIGKNKLLVYVILISLLIGIVQNPVRAESMGISNEGGTTVSTREEFMSALQNRQSPITVNGLITIGKDAETSGRMLPVKIPAGTVINGSTEDSTLNCRAPIQLEGDGVVFSNLKLLFESTDALGSVPQREIFLAGHSLTLDHVYTYLEGGGGSLGGLGGTEKELLPTVYAGGFTGASVGTNASLTVQNSTDKTMFQGIYMGHDEGTDRKVSYRGASFVKLDAPAVVRDGIFTDLNSAAEIQITDVRERRSAKAVKFYGNAQTTLHISKCSVFNAVVENVGSVVLDEGGHLDLVSASLNDVSVKNNACLDFHQVSDAVINGNFYGQDIESAAQNEQIGTLVLNREGHLNICGTVTGLTRFHTDNRAISGPFYDKRGYITENLADLNEKHFVLPQKNIDDGYTLEYEGGAWTVHAPDFGYDDIQIGSIEVVSAPAVVDISAITMKDETDIVPDESVFCNIVWRDEQGEVISSETVEEYQFYFNNLVIIKTEYLQSEDPSDLNNDDWENISIFFRTLEAHLGNYYLCANDGAKSGDYTFLLFPEYVEELTTVADVKAIRDSAKASFRVVFYDSSKGETPPVHQHNYTSQVTKEATCTETGIRTYTCAECGDSYTEPIAKIAHTEVIDTAEAASCTKEGKTEGSHCSVCGTIIKAQETIPKLAHNYEEAITKPATCQETGIKTLTCTVCGDKKTETIAKLAHTEVIDAAEAASCTKEGKTEGSHCSECGTITKAQETIPKLAHNYEEAITKPASCQETGIKALTCTVCGDKKTETIAKTEHDYEEEITKPASCQETGIKTLTCTICRDEKTESIAKLAHTEVKDAAEAASCTKEGKTEGSHCSECGTIIQEQEVIPKTAHNYEEEITKPATCQETGIKTMTCTICRDEKTQIIAKIAHKEVIDAAIPASCTRKGKTQGSHCSVCKKVIRVQNSVPMTAHQYQTKVTKASPGKNGANITSCKKCDKVLKQNIIYSPKTVELSSENYIYNGKEQKPNVVVKDSSGKEITSKNYIVSYQENKNAGVAEVKISFKESYSGTLTKAFTIRPKSTSITRVEVKANRLKIKWKKQKNQVSGYVIQYSTKKNFKGKTTKSIMVKRAAETSKVIKNLKKGKKYFIRICTYKSSILNGENVPIYSDWSKVKVSKKIK